MSIPSVGYSGTPLWKKLGMKPAQKVCLLNPPSHYADLTDPLYLQVNLVGEDSLTPELVHAFVTWRTELVQVLEKFRHVIHPDGSLWISWPKKIARVPTDITEDTIREVGLPMGWVDVKVCAVDEKWSGLKMMIRKELR